MAKEFNREQAIRSQNPTRIKKSEFRHHLFIESFGVKISLSSNEREAVEAVRRILPEQLPDCFREIPETETTHRFMLVWNKSRRDSLYKNGESCITRSEREFLVDYVGSQIRLAVAECAVGRVFVHSGAVAWKGKAILIPARTFKGKTALTAELVRRGAVYYSDEYAVLDREGFNYPFPKPLSIRGEIDEHTQIDYPVEALGGRAGTEKIPVGLVLITEYKPNARWNPQILSRAKGIIEIIKNTVPIRYNPKFTLEVLNQVANRALIVKSRRGDVSKTAALILEFFESQCF